MPGSSSTLASHLFCLSFCFSLCVGCLVVEDVFSHAVFIFCVCIFVRCFPCVCFTFDVFDFLRYIAFNIFNDILGGNFSLVFFQ